MRFAPRPAPQLFGLRLNRRRQKQIIILVLSLLTVLGGSLFLRGKVIAVPDGDTLLLLTPDFERKRVRLYGVDCPESQQAGGGQATDFVSSLALFEEITITVIDRDRYGRDVVLAKLADGRLLNEELVRAGHAWVYDAYCRIPQCLAWRALEKTARTQRLGLWQDEKPQPPWKWRQKHRRK